MWELLALRWRDIDFPAQTLRVTASYTNGKLGTPKSGLGRAVPLVDEVAQALARLGTRKRWAGPEDLVFPGQRGEYLDDSALRRRFKRARDAAGLRPLRFHDLRHTFGSVAIRTVDPRELQEWMGHSDFSTTQIYMHYKPRADATRRPEAWQSRAISEIACLIYQRTHDRILFMADGPRNSREEPDALDEMIAEFTDANPDFPHLLLAAERRRALLRTLAEQRKGRKLSQTRVAAAMSTSQPTLARLETTAADTKLSTVERFAGALGYSIEYHLVPAKKSKGRPGIVVEL